MKKHCCQEMDKAIAIDCKIHSDIYSCPDVLVRYISRFDEYGIVVHDGGSSAIEIKFCPWCGCELPGSKRDLWFQTLESMGFDDPAEQNVPKEFSGDAWYRNT